MTDLSRKAFFKSLIRDTPISALYSATGKCLRSFNPSAEWKIDNDRLLRIIEETLESSVPIYRPITTEDRETVIVYAVAVKGREESVVLISLFPMNEVEQYQHDAELLDAAIEMIEEAVLITDSNNKIIRINGAFQRLTGYNFADLEGKNPQYLASGNTSAKTYEEMWNQLLLSGEWSGEIWDRRKDGSIYPKWLSLTVIRNQQGTIVNYIGVFTDRTKDKEIEKLIDTMAYYDALTQLPNRHYVKEQLARMTPSCVKSHQTVAILFIDLDRFKIINDSLGHASGDRLILEMANRIRSTVRKNDIVARIGGDEFLIVLPSVEHTSDAIEVAEKLLDQFTRPCVIDDVELYTSTSIGISFFPSDGETDEAVIQHAEQAMYMAKKQGGKRFEVFNPALNEETLRRLQIENDLHRAIGQNEFRLVFQPQINSINGTIIGVEALIRWTHAEFGAISPVEFIPIAEECGCILEIGEWVMREALETLSRWLTAGFGPVRMAINISARQFSHPDFVGIVKKMIDELHIPPHLVELEVTESTVMDEPFRAIQICRDLQQYGIEFAIDDFGTGYSSLAYLKIFPVTHLKIDKTFIDDIGDGTHGATLAEAIIALAGSLKMEVVAEGVETIEQLQFLRERGCDIIQGYYYSPPKEEREITAYLMDNPFLTDNPVYLVTMDEELS